MTELTQGSGMSDSKADALAAVVVVVVLLLAAVYWVSTR